MELERLALIVEDDAEIARFVSLVINDLEFDFEVITNGQQALDRLAEVVPHLLILDLNLPGASGLQILQAVRRDPSLAHVPVVVITANPRMAEGIYDLANLVLIKPVSFDQLRDLVSRLA